LYIKSILSSTQIEMNRLCIFMILFALAASALAWNVRAKRGCGNKNCMGDVDPNAELDETTTTTATIDNDDESNVAPTTKSAFRKRRAANSIIESKKSESASDESEGSGDKSTTSPNSIGQGPLIKSGEELISLREDDFNSSKADSAPAKTANSSSNEVGSGENETPDPSSNQLVDPKTAGTGEIAVLKKKVHQWQQAVDNYLSGQRRRKRQQSLLAQFFPSGTSSNTFNSAKGSNSFSSAGYAVGDALKPAMELMTQGVDLIGDLYTTQLKKSDSFSVARQGQAQVSDNDTIAVDQFRGQLRQLQSKLGDLGEQLQRVVNSFQQMQLPFFNNIMSSGMFNAPSAPDANTGKTKNDKNALPFL